VLKVSVSLKTRKDKKEKSH